MTDYTPENRIQEQVDSLHNRSTAAEKSLRFTTGKFAELVREASRLKQERDELLEALKDALNMKQFWVNNAQKLVAKVEKSDG